MASATGRSGMSETDDHVGGSAVLGTGGFLLRQARAMAMSGPRCRGGDGRHQDKSCRAAASALSPNEGVAFMARGPRGARACGRGTPADEVSGGQRVAPTTGRHGGLDQRGGTLCGAFVPRVERQRRPSCRRCNCHAILSPWSGACPVLVLDTH